MTLHCKADSPCGTCRIHLFSLYPFLMQVLSKPMKTTLTSYAVHKELFFNRATFNWVSKVIRDRFSFALRCCVIGPGNSRHSLNQSDAKLKPITTWSVEFSRALDILVGFILSSHWLFRVFSFLLIGHCNDLVLVSQLSIEKRSNVLCSFSVFCFSATAPFTTFVPSPFFLSRPRFLHSWKLKALTVTSSFFLTRKESIYCAKWTT